MKSFLIILILVLSGFVSYACLWDKDTIAMEREQFPSTMELIAGKFLRHSPEFYYWRVKKTEALLQEDPSVLSHYDDLAVAYSKLGNDKKAIGITLRKNQLAPGLYETYANLGTFYIHDGQLENGLIYIDSALYINPDAHFGREIIQRQLVEYLLAKSHGGTLRLPIAGMEINNGYGTHGSKNNFYGFLLRQNIGQHENGDILTQEEAIKGILGMMKFGNYNSPILLEALGDVLLGVRSEEAPRQLIARAYLKASYSVNDSLSAASYRKRAEIVLRIQTTGKAGQGVVLEEIEEQLQQEILEAEKFYQEIRTNELAWIKQGLDPGSTFSKTYYRQPVMSRREQPGIDKHKKVDTAALASFHVLFDSINTPQIDSSYVTFIDSIFHQETVVIAAPTYQTESSLYPWKSTLLLVSLLIIILLIVRKKFQNR